MRLLLIAAVCVGMSVPRVAGQDTPSRTEAQWPQWRGPLGTGVAPHAQPASEWSESTNIRWKVALGGGHSSPIVWGDRVYVQTAVPTVRTVKPTERPQTQPSDRGHRARGRHTPPPAPTNIHEFKLLALDRGAGRIVWQRTLCESVPHEAGHRTASHASNSPVTDGEHIYAYFGSRGLYCVDLKGNVVWQKKFGQMKTRRGFGEGSSPALYGDTLVVVWDHEGDDFIVALDKRTGKERWRAAREEPTSWATPVIAKANGGAQVVASATNAIRAYDLHNGKLLWTCRGMTVNVIPTPICADGLLYATSGFRGNALLAIRYGDARGDITGTAAVAWQYDGKGTPYVPSPVLYDGKFYFLSNFRAQLSCVDAGNGQRFYGRERLPELEQAYASLVAADGRIYVVGRGGKTAVIAHGPQLKVLAVNTLEDEFDASPAIVGKELFLRGHKHMYCIAAD